AAPPSRRLLPTARPFGLRRRHGPDGRRPRTSRGNPGGTACLLRQSRACGACPMSNWKFALLTALAVAGGAALAKLPPPTPEEQKAAAEEKRLKAEQMRKEKEALERAQDRVVEHYRRSRSS